MDIPNEEKDRKIADKIINFEKAETPFTSEFLFKYLLYAKKLRPKLTKETAKELEEFYIKMRKKAQGTTGALMITARQLEGLIRLSEAYAKLRLADKTNKKDAEKAIGLFKRQLRTFGFDPESGELDVDKMEGRISSKERKETRTLLEVFKDLTIMFGERVPMGDFIEACGREGIKKPENKIKKAIRVTTEGMSLVLMKCGKNPSKIPIIFKEN